jgi:hypothetical protein
MTLEALLPNSTLCKMVQLITQTENGCENTNKLAVTISLINATCK